MTQSPEDPKQKQLAPLHNGQGRIGTVALLKPQYHDDSGEGLGSYDEGRRPGTDRQGLMVDDIDPSNTHGEEPDEANI